MKLFYSPGACSLASHIVLNELGLDFQIEKVDLSTKTTETGRKFLEINPKGYVPALEISPGVVLSEGVAILQYLASKKPGNTLIAAYDSLEYFQQVEWLVFISTELHKNLGALFAGPNPAVLERVKPRLEFVSAQLKGKDFLLGSQFSLADAYLFTVLSWTDHLQVDLSGYAGINEYRQRVAARASVQKSLEAEGLLAAAK
jgi:glutathione S-transferase